MGSQMRVTALLIAPISALLLMLSSCSRQAPVVGSVMVPGQEIEFHNKFGEMSVQYISPVKRRFIARGQEITIKLWPRREPFEGMQGLYYGHRYAPMMPWERLIYSETTRNFNSYDEIYKELYQGSGVLDWVYTEDGLVVGLGYSRDRSRDDIVIEQFLINGAKPHDLKGARPDNINVYHKEGS